jgi:hypothetical protein
MTQLKLNNGWSVQGFSFMRGRRIQLQGFRGGFGMYALGFNKDFNNGKGSIGLAMENFATNGWTIRSELESPTFSQVSNRQLYNNNIKVNFTYKIGKLDFSEKNRKTRSVTNDDLMGGGDMNQGGNNNKK